MYDGTFFDHFSNLEDEDTRQEGKVRHKLIELLFITVSAVISGCNDWKEISIWANAEINVKWLKKYIELLHGPPSLSTIKRLFNIVDPVQFEKHFVEWMEAVINLPEKDIISIDGKTMRGSQEKLTPKKAVHIVSALCKSNGLVLGQVKTDEKSNEITAIPELLDLLYIEGCIVTIDAMGTQREIAEKIVNDNKAYYVLSLKGNQSNVHKEVEDYFNSLEEDDILQDLKNDDKEVTTMTRKAQESGLMFFETKEKGHGRIETRTYYYSTDTDWMIDAKKDWPELNGIGMVDREIIINDEITTERNFYIGSVDNIEDFSTAVRSHWGVESMHWSLDVTFRDDDNRTRKGNAPQNMAVLKRIAFNTVLADKEKHPKESKKSKRLLAQLDSDYRDYLLNLNFKDR